MNETPNSLFKIIPDDNLQYFKIVTFLDMPIDIAIYCRYPTSRILNLIGVRELFFLGRSGERTKEGSEFVYNMVIREKRLYVFKWMVLTITKYY